ncbi:hypothetical protein [Bacillus massiliigorillae]|uniref:hypothetical protein n=1 Tax=Bacillus massiliigorillae TaxID=1243664 RepID=UPI0003A3A30A|nr:hypothetical protein [Bacillus massiliigorillae]
MGACVDFDNTVIILDELKFDWNESDLREVISLYNEGIKASKIALRFRITLDDIFLVLFHLMREKRIKSRPGGWLG